MMDINITPAEDTLSAASRQTKKDFRRDVSTVMLCSLIMLMMLYLDDGIHLLLVSCDSFFISLVELLPGMDHAAATEAFERFATSDALDYVITITVQLAMLLIPALIAVKTLRSRPAKIYPLRAELPERPWSFIGLTFGLCYSVNIVCSLLFSRFYPNIESLDIAGVAVSFVSVVIIAPIFEELVFRGVFFQSLMKYDRVFAVVLTACIFGLMHRNPPSIINALVFGTLTALGLAKTGSILICVVMHMTNNAISFAAINLMHGVSGIAFALLLTLFFMGMIGFAAALCINMFVSKRRSVISLPQTVSDIPRVTPRDKAVAVLACPWTWLFAALLAYSVWLLYSGA